MSTIARGQITITDLSDGKSVSLFLGSNSPLTQIYDSDDGSFTPNWVTAATNLKITPEIYVTGADTNQISRLLAAPTWKINGSETLSTYGAVASSTAPYTLTINKNMSDVSQLLIECDATYVDPLTSAQTKAKATINYTKSINSGAISQAIIYAPDGTIFDNNTAELKAHCDLWRGASIDTTNVTYEWYKRSEGVWTKITSANAAGISDYTTNEITVSKDAVLNVGTFKCRIIDNDSLTAGDPNYREALITFNDMSDPFQTELTTDKGNVLSSGLESTTVKATVYQGGVAMSDDWHDDVEFEWRKYKKDGSQDTAWGTSGVKTGRTLSVARSEISVASTFTVAVKQN